MNERKITLKSIFNPFINMGVITWLLIILIWWILSLFQSEVLLPSPIETIKGSAEIILNGKLFLFALISLRRVFIGWGLGLIIGIPLGLIVGREILVRRLMEPFINFFRFVPGLAMITLFLMWFGGGEVSKIALITYGTVFTVMVNIISGVVSLSSDRINSARVLGIPERQIMLTVIWPSVIPYAFTSARLGLGGAFTAIVAAEMLSAKEGIGYLIFTARMYFHTDWIITGVITLGLLGYLSDKLLRILGNKFLKKYGVKEKKEL